MIQQTVDNVAMADYHQAAVNEYRAASKVAINVEMKKNTVNF